GGGVGRGRRTEAAVSRAVAAARSFPAGAAGAVIGFGAAGFAAGAAVAAGFITGAGASAGFAGGAVTTGLTVGAAAGFAAGATAGLATGAVRTCGAGAIFAVMVAAAVMGDCAIAGAAVMGEGDA